MAEETPVPASGEDAAGSLLDAPPPEAHYRDGNIDRHCEVCVHYQNETCDLWSARVAPDMLSDGFEPPLPEAGPVVNEPLLSDDPPSDVALAAGSGLTRAGSKRVGGMPQKYDPNKHLHDPRTGKFVHMPDILKAVQGGKAVDLSFIIPQQYKNIRGLVVTPGPQDGGGKKEVMVTIGLKVGEETGVISLLVGRKLLGLDMLGGLLERINLGKRLKAVIRPGIRQYGRASYYNFYNIYRRQVAQTIPGLSEDGMEKFELGELFCSDSETVEEDGLIWKTSLPVGELAVRPGWDGKPVHRPLRVIEGKTDDPRRAIGLQDIVEAFNEGAVPHVTVPLSHTDLPQENTGFVRKLRIGKTKAGMPALQAGLDFTEPEIAEKTKRGSIADVSVGLAFDYTRKQDGKKFPIVLQHLALTNKPWVPGMDPFGIKASDDEESVFEFSEDDVSEVIPLEMASDVNVRMWDAAGGLESKRRRLQEALDRFADEYKLIDFNDFEMLVESVATGHLWVANYNDLSGGTTDIYDPETWLAMEGQEVPEAPPESTPSDESTPETVDASDPSSPADGLALAVPGGPGITDVQDEMDQCGLVLRDVLEYLQKDANAPADLIARVQDCTEMLNAEGDEGDMGGMSELSDIERAQVRRRFLLSESTRTWTPKHDAPKGGVKVEKDVLEMSEDELREAVVAERRRAAQSQRQNAVDERINELQGLGLSDQPGFLRVVRELLLADDGEPAAVLLSEDGRKREGLTVSDVVNRLIDAIPRDKDGRVALSEQHVDVGGERPAATEEDERPVSERADEVRKSLGLRQSVKVTQD